MSSPKLREVVAALEKRHRLEEAMYYSTTLSLLVQIHGNISPDDVMDLTVEEVVGILAKPPRPDRYQEWSTFYWGEKAFADARG